MKSSMDDSMSLVFSALRNVDNEGVCPHEEPVILLCEYFQDPVSLLWPLPEVLVIQNFALCDDAHKNDMLLVLS